MGKHKEKEIKTNAMRILDKNKIPSMNVMNLSTVCTQPGRQGRRWNSLSKRWWCRGKAGNIMCW